jgi:hypothetical protein
MKRIVKVTDHGRKRVIGVIDDHELTYTKKVDMRRHLYKVLDAWGIDGKLFTNHLWPLNYTIIVNETTEGKQYRISAEEAKMKGDFLNHKPGAQLFVPRKCWTVGPIK